MKLAETDHWPGKQLQGMRMSSIVSGMNEPKVTNFRVRYSAPHQREITQKSICTLGQTRSRFAKEGGVAQPRRELKAILPSPLLQMPVGKISLVCRKLENHEARRDGHHRPGKQLQGMGMTKRRRLVLQLEEKLSSCHSCRSAQAS